MPMYYIKDLANPEEEMWGDQEIWRSTHKGDLKPQRDLLNEDHPAPEGVGKRFVIGTMK